ncbi:MAG TPA: hypothetical protein VLW50_11595 [Streptosporangiaceae bacterium]|nr:hypothetical protein [Streptosporangiaceae bacterium]
MDWRACGCTAAGTAHDQRIDPAIQEALDAALERAPDRATVLSARAMRVHIASIVDKLQVAGRAAAVELFQRS